MKLNTEAVKARRSELRESQEVLAVRAGISKSALQYLEHGTRDPRLATAEKLAAALGVPLAAITADEEAEVA